MQIERLGLLLHLCYSLLLYFSHFELVVFWWFIFDLLDDFASFFGLSALNLPLVLVNMPEESTFEEFELFEVLVHVVEPVDVIVHILHALWYRFRQIINILKILSFCHGSDLIRLLLILRHGLIL